MFDVYYIGDNPELCEHIPFAQQIDSENEVSANTKMYWIIEPNVEILDYEVLEYRPPDHDQIYTHVWKWNAANYGGLKLLPRTDSEGIKEVNRVVCRKRFDILNTKTPGKYFDKNPHATHVWCVDPEYKISADINWAPDNFEPDFIHSFHLRGQLEHKYPELEGGIKLYPRQWKKADIKYHGFLDAAEKYPVIWTTDVEDYAQRDIHDDDYVWLIDNDHLVNPATIDWAPNPFEDGMIHSFRMPYQLTEKYPYEMGGIRLVPRNWKKAKLKIHLDCPVEDENYDVFYIDSEDFNSETYTEYAQRSRTEWFWMVDRDFRFNGKLLYVPAEHERDYIHVFKIPGHLDYRYPADITEPGDLRCGGVRLMHKQFDVTKQKYQPNVVPVRFDIYRVNNVSDFDVYAKKSRTKMFWLVDADYIIDDLSYVPDVDEQKYLLNFRIPDQLEHKYPEKEGGIYLIPKNLGPDTAIKYKGAPQIKKPNYPIIYVDDPSDYSQAMGECWLVDKEYQIDEHIDWVPNNFEKSFIHTFHAPGQLEHKYPEAMGGIRWVPGDWKNAETKIHSKSPFASAKYPVLYVDNPDDYSQAIGECWLVDREYQINDNIEWIPSNFERSYIHAFHVPGQLKHKYPEAMGGIRWVPKNWQDAKIKIHSKTPLASAKYPVLYVDNPDDYSQAIGECWLVDKEYQINENIEWIPSNFERSYIHAFHVPGQLTHKYPEAMGGIRWVPKQWQDAEIKIHTETPFASTSYPVIYVDDPGDYSQAMGECWLVDREYQISENIEWVPSNFERAFIHTFHVPGQLRHKYPEEMGGVRWVPKDWQNAEIKIHTETPLAAPTYSLIYVDDPSDYSQARGECWLVDKEYQIDEYIEWIPSNFERSFIHTFHVPGQLRHKYPEEMGGVRWIPKDWKNAEVKIHTETPFDAPRFETYPDEETGRQQTTKDWFWVIDPNVDVLSNFNFDFVPESWDSGKTHVWQKLNPITERQYDYSGIMLCPKEPKSTGRPKYIREPACVHKAYPVYTLDGKKPILEQLEKLDSETTVDMYWVVDPHVEVDQDFAFDYYPTQWDVENVHVFSTNTGRHAGVRLYPTGTFAEGHEYTALEINNNSFDKLKLMDTVACTAVEWPIEQLTEFNKDKFLSLVGKYKAKKKDFFWTVDPDVEEVENVVKSGFVPEIVNSDKVHVWQRVNPHTSKVQGYGGVRLWPTARDYSDITSDSLRLNKLKRLHYMREPGSTYKYFEVVFLSYHEPGAQEAYDRLCERVNAHWVKDVEGIFDAHQEAAKKVSSTMFWVVDADAELAETFDFSYIPDVYDQEVTHVWASKNPVTGHEYGYGGVKLFNTRQVLDATSWGLDFTTGLSSRFKAMPEISCTTRFNTDAFSTWRSAFRESVKLALKDDTESQVRLQSWLFPLPGVDFRAEAKAGAQAGKEYALANANKPMRLAKINDYEWLQEQYDEYQSESQ